MLKTMEVPISTLRRRHCSSGPNLTVFLLIALLIDSPTASLDSYSTVNCFSPRCSSIFDFPSNQGNNSISSYFRQQYSSMWRYTASTRPGNDNSIFNSNQNNINSALSSSKTLIYIVCVLEQRSSLKGSKSVPIVSEGSDEGQQGSLMQCL